MNAIGIIANPASGKDIRRLVAYGASSDNTEKINMVRRILMGARAAKLRTVYYMPDYFNIIETAVKGIFQEHRDYIAGLEILRLDIPVTGTEEDTTAAAKKINELGIGCVIILGGDGTCRAAAKGIGDVPIVPISTGTNNVFPEIIEGTIAGMAAGAFASGTLFGAEAFVTKSKKLEICKNGSFCDIALVDAVVLKETHLASRALWKIDTFSQIFLTCSSAYNLGISAVGGQLKEISKTEPLGLHIEVDAGKKTILAPIAPGLFAQVGIKDYKTVEPGESVSIAQTPCVIAVDGERNIEVLNGESASIKLTWNGPKILDVKEVLRAARERRLFYL